jgi:CheY-like chemotaxis protein
MSKLISPCGHITEIAENGYGAIDKAVIFQPHIILMDISLPDIDGREAALRIRQEHAFIIIIGFSGHRLEDLQGYDNQYIFDHYMQNLSISLCLNLIFIPIKLLIVSIPDLAVLK